MADNSIPDVIPADKFVPDTQPVSGQSAPIGTQSSPNSQQLQGTGTQSAQDSPDVIPADQFEADEDKYGSPTEQLKTGLEGAAQGVAGPLAPMAEEAMGVDPGAIRGRQAANPVTHGVGEAAGFGGSMLTGIGEGALASKLGLHLAGEIGEGANLASKIGNVAARSAVENMVVQSGDELSKMITHDPNTSAQTAIPDIGLAGLLGAGIGGSFAAVSPLAKLTGLNKLGQLAADFSGRLSDHIANPEPVEAVTKELTEYYNGIKGIASEVYGPEGIKAQDIGRLMPEMNDKIANHSAEVSEKLTQALQKLSKDPNVGNLQEMADKYNQVLTSNNPGEIFNATQDLKQQLQEVSKYNNNMTPLSEKAFRNTAKSLASDLRASLEDTSVWGKAAERQQSINKAFSEYLPTLKDFESKYTEKVEGQPVISPGKIQTMVNQVGKASGDIKKTILGNFIDKSNQYKDVIAASHAGLGLDNPITPTSLNSTMSLLKDRTTGGKLADIFIEKGLSDAGSKALGAGVGAGIGHSFGMGELGALLGAHTLGPFFKSTLPALVKPLLSIIPSGEGLRAAAEYGASIVKGDNAITRAAKSIFKPIGYETTTHMSDTHITKLDKMLKEYQTNPQKLGDINNSVAHYLPDHGAALTSTATNAVNYLNSLRPNRTKASPLDHVVTPSIVEKNKYTSALRVAQQPLSVFESLKRGTLSPTEITTLKVLYPSLYNSMAQKLTNELMNASHKNVQIPYKVKTGLSMFLGQPMHSTMQPASIQAAQLANQGSSSPQQQPAPKTKGTSALSKFSSQYQTSSQAAEADQAKR